MKKMKAHISYTGTVTVHFKSGRPIVFPGTVLKRHSVYSDEQPMVFPAPPMRLGWIDWSQVNGVTVVEPEEVTSAGEDTPV